MIHFYLNKYECHSEYHQGIITKLSIFLSPRTQSRVFFCLLSIRHNKYINKTTLKGIVNSIIEVISSLNSYVIHVGKKQMQFKFN